MSQIVNDDMPIGEIKEVYKNSFCDDVGEVVFKWGQYILDDTKTLNDYAICSGYTITASMKTAGKSEKEKQEMMKPKSAKVKKETKASCTKKTFHIFKKFLSKNGDSSNETNDILLKFSENLFNNSKKMKRE